MSRPTQVYAVTLRHRGATAAVLAITHRMDAENGLARAVEVASIEELAEFSEGADEDFGTRALVRKVPGDDRILFPDMGVAEQACLALADLWRSGQDRRLERGAFEVEMMAAIQVSPPGSLWRVRYRLPYPDPITVLARLGTARTRQPAVALPVTAQATEATPATPACFAGFPEPLIWFGPPPYPSSKDRILQRPWYPPRVQRLLGRGAVRGIETLIYSNGLIVALTDERERARTTINQIFGVLSRSGMDVLALPDFELIEVTQFDRDSGAIGGSSAAVTPRNRIVGIPRVDRGTEMSYYLPEGVLERLFAVADETASDDERAVASLRLLNAVTLLRRQYYTEAFVTGWTLIETSIERDFEAFWLRDGRSKTAVAEMDWTVAQQVDLLTAVDIIDRSLGEQIQGLRKRRNAIVHDLADSTDKEAVHCVEVATARTPLPLISEGLSPLLVFL